MDANSRNNMVSEILDTEDFERLLTALIAKNSVSFFRIINELPSPTFQRKVELIRRLRNQKTAEDNTTIIKDKNTAKNYTVLELLQEHKHEIYDPSHFWIHFAVEERNINCLKALFDRVHKVLIKKVNVNGLNQYGETPLFVAVKIGWLEGVTFLLRSGADIGIILTKSSTPKEGKCDNKPGENNKIITKQTVFHLCVSMKDSEERKARDWQIFKALVTKVKDMIKAEQKGKSNAEVQKEADAADAGVSREASEVPEGKKIMAIEILDIPDDEQCYPLAIAISNKKEQHVKELLDAGVPISLADSKGNNVFHRAAKIGDVDLLIRLWAHCATDGQQELAKTMNKKA